MMLKTFIRELENIANQIDNPDAAEVQMADCTPVVMPILKGNTVYITDMDPEEEEA